MAKRKKGQRIPLLLLTAIIICIASILSITPNTTDITINFDKTVNIPHQHTGPTLHVAVAAMTSPQTTRRRYRDLILLIGEKLHYTVEFIQRPTYTEVDKLLEKHEVDIAFVCSGSYALGHDQYGLELLVIPVIEGKTTYNSNIIVAKSSTFQSLEDLRNHRFSFTSKTSNTGFLAPNFLLETHGESAETFFSETLMSHGHDNSVQAVANGLVDGASVDSLILDHMILENNPNALNVRVIHTSKNFGIPPVVVPKQLDPILKKQLRNFFLEAHQSPEGRKILSALRIDHFILGDDSHYNSIREMARVCAKH